MTPEKTPEQEFEDLARRLSQPKIKKEKPIQETYEKPSIEKPVEYKKPKKKRKPKTVYNKGKIHSNYLGIPPTPSNSTKERTIKEKSKELESIVSQPSIEKPKEEKKPKKKRKPKTIYSKGEFHPNYAGSLSNTVKEEEKSIKEKLEELKSLVNQSSIEKKHASIKKAYLVCKREIIDLGTFFKKFYKESISPAPTNVKLGVLAYYILLFLGIPLLGQCNKKNEAPKTIKKKEITVQKKEPKTLEDNVKDFTSSIPYFDNLKAKHTKNMRLLGRRSYEYNTEDLEVEHLYSPDKERILFKIKDTKKSETYLYVSHKDNSKFTVIGIGRYKKNCKKVYWIFPHRFIIDKEGPDYVKIMLTDNNASAALDCKKKELIEGKKSWIYSIKSDDSLERISKRNNISVEEIKKANPNINLKRIYVNQKINLPGEKP